MTEAPASGVEPGSAPEGDAPEPNPATLLGGDNGDDPGGETTFGDYRDNLPAELRANPALANLASVEDLANEHVNVQKMIGAKGIIPPGDDATDEDREKFYNALGRPETVEGYDLSKIEVPEGFEVDEGMQSAILASMHARGATQDMVEGVFSDYWERMAEGQKLADENANRVLTETEKAMQAEHGNEWPQVKALADQAVQAVFGEGLDDVLHARLPDGSKVGSHPAFVKGFAALGKQMAEANLLGEKSAALGTSPEAAKAELEAFTADPENQKALIDRAHPRHKEVQDRKSHLTQLAYPKDEHTVMALG